MPLGSVADFLTENAEALTELSDGIWNTPELALYETKSSETLAAALEAGGFAVQRGVAGMPTAFTATYGEGAPVIALLIFTGRKDIMGAFANSRLTNVAALGGAVLILTLNAILLAQVFGLNIPGLPGG